jgi:hypothetical protein
VRAELDGSKQPLQDVLKRLNPAWNLVGRVHYAGARKLDRACAQHDEAMRSCT